LGPLDEPLVQKFLRALVRSALYLVIRRELRWAPRVLGVWENYMVLSDGDLLPCCNWDCWTC
jgi:hypothetical protein